MKNGILLIFLFLIHTAAFSQVTGGGIANPSSDNEQKKAEPKDKVRGFGSFTFGFNFPAGGLGSYDLEEFIPEAMGASIGYSIDWEGCRYLNLPIDERFKIGLDYSFLAGLFTLDSRFKDDLNEFEYAPPLYAGIKIGPSVSYFLDENIAFDAFFKIGPVLGYGGSYNFEGTDGSFYYADALAGVGILPSIGIQARLGGLQLGLERSMGSVSQDFDLSLPYTSGTESFDVPFGYTRLSVGFSVNKKD